MHISIIGGGIAGTACAYFLAQRGASCVIYDQGDDVATGASGNVRGLYNPRFFAAYDAEAQFYASAFQSALRVFEDLGDDIAYDPCGAVHLINTEQKQKRFAKMVESWPWGADDFQILSPEKTSEIMGLPCEYESLYLPRSGMVSPQAICRAYARESGATLKLGARVESKDLPGLLSDSDAVIFTCGMGALNFAPCADLPLRPMRGQVSLIDETPQTRALKTVVCYGGYMTPSFDGMHCVGSTFDRGVDRAAVKDGDHEEIIGKMQDHIKAFQAGSYPCTQARAGVRVGAPGHFPVIGDLGQGMYISAAHGSHGILSSLMGAQILTAQIYGDAPPVAPEVIERLSPHRFS